MFKHLGDGIVARFDAVGAAVAAAVEAQRGLAGVEWGAILSLMVRIGIHAGEAQQRAGDWFGPVLNRTARLMAVGHGGIPADPSPWSRGVRDGLGIPGGV